MFTAFKLLFVYVFLGTISGLIFIPYSMMVGNVDFFYRVVIWIMRVGLWAARIRVEVVGREHVPVGVSCIFLSNHVSNLDPPVIFPVLPGRSSVLLKKELMKIPLMGRAMRMGMFVPVDRGNRREAARASMEAASEALRTGLHMLIFAEGTRSKDGRLAAFKRGPFYLAEATGAPLVPVAISGTEKMMTRGSGAIAPGVARVEFLAAIDPQQYGSRDELMKVAHAALAAALPAEMKPLGTVVSG